MRAVRAATAKRDTLGGISRKTHRSGGWRGRSARRSSPSAWRQGGRRLRSPQNPPVLPPRTAAPARLGAQARPNQLPPRQPRDDDPKRGSGRAPLLIVSPSAVVYSAVAVRTFLAPQRFSEERVMPDTQAVATNDAHVDLDASAERTPHDAAGRQLTHPGYILAGRPARDRLGTRPLVFAGSLYRTESGHSRWAARRRVCGHGDHGP